MSKSIFDRIQYDPSTEEEVSRWMKRIIAGDGTAPLKDIRWFGQPHIIAQITPFLGGDEPFPHSLLLGEPGLGKTHLAEWIANERSEPFEEMLAPADPNRLPVLGIVLIDEVHLQRKPEPLFKIMEDDRPTILAATTRPEVVDKAFRSRFFLELHLQRYTTEEMAELLRYELAELHFDGGVEATVVTKSMMDTIEVLATAAAGNPRQAKRLAEVARRLDTIDPEVILAACQVTADGLTELHMRYLAALAKANRPIGLSQLTAVLYSDEGTVRGLEPLLLDYDLIELNPNGRSLSRKGTAYVKSL